MNLDLIKPIDQIIPEKNIIVFSPHYDDVLFFLGGYLLELKNNNLLNTKSFHVKICFSRSNYMLGHGAENLNPSLDRIKFATGQRILEDLNCLNEIFGRFGYTYELLDEDEAFVRGVNYAKSKMEFPFGNYSNFTKNDNEILNRLVEKIKLKAQYKDTAMVFPLSYKDHIDHFLCREAALLAANDLKELKQATFYFVEDKPYAGLADEQEQQIVESIIEKTPLSAQFYAFDPEKMIELAYKHYITQIEEIYAKGIRKRATFWQNKMGTSHKLDRILKL